MSANNVFLDATIPKPQEVYRCPPIEWGKYRVLGAPLDAMHERRQRNQPTGGPGVPHSMQTGGIIGMAPTEYGEDSGLMRRPLRLFDGLGQRGSVVGR